MDALFDSSGGIRIGLDGDREFEVPEFHADSNYTDDEFSLDSLDYSSTGLDSDSGSTDSACSSCSSCGGD